MMSKVVLTQCPLNYLYSSKLNFDTHPCIGYACAAGFDSVPNLRPGRKLYIEICMLNIRCFNIISVRIIFIFIDIFETGL